MTSVRIDMNEHDLVQVKIFEAPMDALQSLEEKINAWLRDNREARLERVQFNTIETKRAVVILWYLSSTRASRGVGFGSEKAATNRD